MPAKRIHASTLRSLVFLGLAMLSGCASNDISDKATLGHEGAEVGGQTKSDKLDPSALPVGFFDSTADYSEFGEVDGRIVKIEQIKIRDYPDYIRKVTLTNDLLFDFAKHNIKPKVRHQINAVAKTIQNQYPDHYIFVVGHTDNVGKAALNTRLSSKRAVSVVQELGRSKYSVNHDRIEVVPAGEFLPILPNTTKENRAKNRRVEIYVTASREVVYQYFRQYGCPEPKCITRDFNTHKVDRNFTLLPTTRQNAQGSVIRANSEVTRVRDNTVEGKQREQFVKQQQRIQAVEQSTRKIEVKLTVRKFTVENTIRKMQLPASYDVSQEDKVRTSLFKYL